jgi:flagellar biosynthetic protein FliR
MDPLLASVLPAETWVYALTFARTGAMVAAMPLFGETVAPVRVRLILALGLTLVLAPLTGIAAVSLPAPGVLAGVVAGEILIGLMVGLSARFVMSAVHMAGNIIAAQLGLSFAMSADPSQNGGQGAIIGTFLSMTAMTLIFVSDLHYLLIGAMRHSYTLFPPMAAVDTGPAAQWSIQLMSSAFALAMQLSAPFIVFAVVIQFTAGLISRLMPQVQIFFMTVPVTILGGFALLMFSLSAMMMAFLQTFEQTLRPLAGG